MLLYLGLNKKLPREKNCIIYPGIFIYISIKNNNSLVKTLVGLVQKITDLRDISQFVKPVTDLRFKKLGLFVSHF